MSLDRVRSARQADDGYAMTIAVIVATLMVSVAAALVLNLTSGSRDSIRQQDLLEARSTGTSALDFMLGELRIDPLFFESCNVTPSTGCSQDWIKAASTTAPDLDTDTEFRRLSNGEDGELRVEPCSDRTRPCWTLRWSDNLYEALGTNPQSAVVEAIVRFECEHSFEKCSQRRFQQRLVKESGEWRRLDLTEVTALNALS